MYREVKKCNNPKYLVITPLKTGDKISKQTKKTVKKNKLPFDWISYEGVHNIPTNTEIALLDYEYKHKKVEYVIKIDNDIEMSKCMLDKMYEVLKDTPDDIAYCYCAFHYYLPDGRQLSFDLPFDEIRLLQSNYISSNSMIKRKALKDVGGFVCDPDYERLLDWALWLKMLYHGYKGVRTRTTKFKTPLNENNVSARGQEDYKLKYQRIYRDFIVPIIEGRKD